MPESPATPSATPSITPLALHADVCARALDARDARFDGLFFVGITTTRIYCRPICPSRISYDNRRRFFQSAAAAECAGFRPCLRCRPELAPGLAAVDAVPRLARAAANRIAAGALNGHAVSELARELGVSERHLRRALEREIGVSPLELAQTYRLLLAKRLLADTRLTITRVAFASGFQSVRRFNATFRERYRMPPSAIRRRQSARGASNGATAAGTNAATANATNADEAPLRLTLAYRPPFAWCALLETLARDAIAGAESIDGGRYGRTVTIAGRVGVVFVEPPPKRASSASGASSASSASGAPHNHLNVELSASLVPALMPLLARLRQLFDLDADPSAIDAHLARGGLGDFVTRTPGVRIPGAIDGFEIALRTLLGTRTPDVVRELGEVIETECAALSRVVPTAAGIAAAGAEALVAVGVPPDRAASLVALAQAVSSGTVSLEPGGDVESARIALARIPGLCEPELSTILMRALGWPDASPVATPETLRAAGVATAAALAARAEAWRPWRAYAAAHLSSHLGQG